MCRLHVLSSFIAIVVGNNHFDNCVIKPNVKKTKLELFYTHSKNTFISCTLWIHNGFNLSLNSLSNEFLLPLNVTQFINCSSQQNTVTAAINIKISDEDAYLLYVTLTLFAIFF